MNDSVNTLRELIGNVCNYDSFDSDGPVNESWEFKGVNL